MVTFTPSQIHIHNLNNRASSQATIVVDVEAESGCHAQTGEHEVKFSKGQEDDVWSFMSHSLSSGTITGMGGHGVVAGVLEEAAVELQEWTDDDVITE